MSGISISFLLSVFFIIHTLHCVEDNERSWNGKSVQKWSLLCKEGDREAMYQIGCLYESEKQVIERNKWFKLAALAGHKDAAFKLCYHAVLIHDFDEAASWYEQAKKNGENDDCRYVALVEDMDTSPFGLLASRWYKKLDEKGNSAATFWLASYYFTKRNFEKSLILFKKADSLGYRGARALLQTFNDHKLFVSKL